MGRPTLAEQAADRADALDIAREAAQYRRSMPDTRVERLPDGHGGHVEWVYIDGQLFTKRTIPAPGANPSLSRVPRRSDNQ